MKERTKISVNIPVLFAGKNSAIMPARKENTAPRHVIESGVQMVDSEYFERVKNYLSAMNQAEIMLSKKLISRAEYRVIETKMCKRYGINSRSLYRVNEWIYPHSRGNMATTKEVI